MCIKSFFESQLIINPIGALGPIYHVLTILGDFGHLPYFSRAFSKMDLKIITNGVLVPL